MDNHSYSELRHGQLLSMLLEINYLTLNHLARGDVAFASPSEATSLPLTITPFKTCNLVSIEPNDYKRSNIINTANYYARIILKVTKVTNFSNQSYQNINENIGLQTRKCFGTIIVVFYIW